MIRQLHRHEPSARGRGFTLMLVAMGGWTSLWLAASRRRTWAALKRAVCITGLVLVVMSVGAGGPAQAQELPADLTQLSLEELMDFNVLSIDVLGTHTHLAGEWMISYRYMLMRMDGNRDGTHNQSVSPVIHTALLSAAQVRLREAAWLSDRTRPFVIVLIVMPTVDAPLLPFAHLGVGCETREEVDRLCEQARQDGCLRAGPTDSGYPIGYWAFLADPDGHTLEIAFGQEVALTVAHPEREE